jgi:hypothetical protein
MSSSCSQGAAAAPGGVAAHGAVPRQHHAPRHPPVRPRRHEDIRGRGTHACRQALHDIAAEDATVMLA